jgi:multidrug transporter EmrE-like cation transporter
MKTKRALYIASGASILVGTIASLTLFDKNFNTASTVGFSLLGAGVVFATSGVYVNMTSSRKLENAFDTYNR